MLSFQEEDYPVFACPECSSMRDVLSLQPAQEARTIKRLLCHHSKVLSHLINNWRNLWKIDGTEVSALDDNDDNVQICSKQNKKNHRF